MPNFTKQELDLFVRMFGHKEAAVALAKHFIENMAEGQCEMLTDMTDAPLPTAEMLLSASNDYGIDMMSDFASFVDDAFNELEANISVNVAVVRTVKIDINYVESDEDDECK